ncbi:hypothetical protein D3C73_1464100 [compost metagenome]
MSQERSLSEQGFDREFHRFLVQRIGIYERIEERHIPKQKRRGKRYPDRADRLRMLQRPDGFGRFAHRAGRVHHAMQRHKIRHKGRIPADPGLFPFLQRI